MATQTKRFLVTYTDANVSQETAIKVLGVNKTKMKEGLSHTQGESRATKDEVLHYEKVGVSVLEISSEEAKKIATKKGVLVVEEDTEVFALGDVENQLKKQEFKPTEVYVNTAEMEKMKSKNPPEEMMHEDMFEANSKDSKQDSPIVGKEHVPKEEFMPFASNRLANSLTNQGAVVSYDNKDVENGSYTEANDGDSAPAESGTYTDGYKKAMLDIFSAMLDANIKPKSGSATSAAQVNAAGDTPHTADIHNRNVPWNVKMIKADKAWAKGYNGYCIKVAVLDTGVDYKHRDLFIYGGRNFTSDYNGDSSQYIDGHGHGTHCAGIIGAREYSGNIRGVAPRSKIYGVKVLTNNGSGYNSWIIAGMEWCIQNGIKVISMSLGNSSSPSTAYVNAISRCQRNGILVVAAAGNEYRTSFPYVGAPANSAKPNWWSPSPIAVGAVDSNSNIAYFSSRGQQTLPWNPVGCVAPGVDVRSTYIGNSYTRMSGTSMACPHVAGLAALLWERWGTNINVYWIKKQILLGTYFSHPYSGSDAKGLGLINCDNVVSSDYTNRTHDYYKKWYMHY